LLGIAVGLTLSGSAMAATAPDATFVGDANVVPQGTEAQAKAMADFRRWGSTVDQAPSVFLPENKAGAVSISYADPATARAAIDAYLAKLDLSPPGSANALEAARIRARLAKIPANQRTLPDDLHPIQFLEYLRTLADNRAGLILPPKNHIKIVDQDEIKRLKATGQPMPQPVYRTTKVTTITHHLVPTFRDVYTEYPV
jgi:hypothetical protein